MTAKIELRQVNKSFGPLPILNNINLDVQPEEFVTLIGPSGCGKSTLFNILAGLDQQDSGEILFDGVPLKPRRGAIALMPQRDALLPWRTVLDNSILALELHGLPKNKARSLARSYFEAFGLQGFENNYPWQLSGGMRQRVAMLRTVLADREVMLLDEPFGALDALTRSSLQTWLLSLKKQLKRTILFITHDVEEALLLSDRVYVLTPRPSTVRLIQHVTLTSLPTSEIISSPEFVALKATLLQSLRQTDA